MTNRRLTGLSANVIEGLAGKLSPQWVPRHRGRLGARTRQRAVGAGARHKLLFVDRLLATLVHLRHGVTHDLLAAWFGVHRSTITRAINEIRPPLAARGCRTSSGVRLPTTADVVAYLDAEGVTGLMDATEVRVRRPTSAKDGRHQFISGKSRQNAMKALTITDTSGRRLFCGATCRGSTPAITQARNAGVVDWLEHTYWVQILTDAGYRAYTPRPTAKSSLPCSGARRSSWTSYRASPRYAQLRAAGTTAAEYASSTASPT